MNSLRTLLASCFLFSLLLQAHAQNKDRHVILITIDGFAAYYLNDPQAPLPNLRRLAREGLSGNLKPSNPTVTWPNHTSLITGVHPEKHSVLFNGVLERGSNGTVAVNPRKDESDLVRVTTLHEVVRRAGLKTGAINWPCTRNSPFIDDNFPDVPEALLHTNPELIEDLVKIQVLPGKDTNWWGNLSSAAKDQVWTQSAAHLINARRPHLLYFHILITDSIQHRYGPNSPAAYTALAQADFQVQELVAKVRAAGLEDKTTFIITADHGFNVVSNVFYPNVLLKEKGLLTTDAKGKITGGKLQAVTSGGMAMIYPNKPEEASALEAQVKELFATHAAVELFISNREHNRYNLPTPEQSPQVGHWVLFAKNGFGFNSGTQEKTAIVAVGDTTTNPGQHGFLSSNPKMHAALIISGGGLKRGLLSNVESIQIAPTIAHILGVKLPGADGAPIDLGIRR
jgi:predicted AlkP superfamily pyrophosphatase or phosphodiesterase